MGEVTLTVLYTNDEHGWTEESTDPLDAYLDFIPRRWTREWRSGSDGWKGLSPLHRI